jgi:hypothetical protein
VDRPLLPANWLELAPLIDAVLDTAPEHRAARILELCAGNSGRQRALTHLVAECERAAPLLDRGAAERFDGLASEAPDALLPELLAARYRVGRELGRGASMSNAVAGSNSVGTSRGLFFAVMTSRGRALRTCTIVAQKMASLSAGYPLNYRVFERGTSLALSLGTRPLVVRVRS